VGVPRTKLTSAATQLAVKKSSLQNLEKRISSLAGELKNAQADLAVDQAQVWPSIIVGDGRVGHALKEMGGPSDVTVLILRPHPTLISLQPLLCPPLHVRR
jgi:hypothetical protein